MFSRSSRVGALLALILATALMLAACSGAKSDGQADDPTVNSEAPSTTTTAVATTTTVDEAAVLAYLASIAPPTTLASTTAVTAAPCGLYCPNPLGVTQPPGPTRLPGEVTDLGGGSPGPNGPGPTGPPSATCDPSGWCVDQNGVQIPPGGVVTTTTPTTSPPGTVAPSF